MINDLEDEMGIFGIFGKKAEKEKEAELEKEEELQAEHEETVNKVKDAHKDLEWPVIQRLNPVNIKDAEGQAMEETVSPDRKDEIGNLIYNEELPIDTLKFLNGQELLFLLTTLEVYNKKSPLPGFKENHRKVYNELLSRIRDAEALYVLYDKKSGFPFVEGGYAYVYFEEELALKAAELFGRQFRNLDAKRCEIETKPDSNGRKAVFFDFLYYIGVENLIVDNGAYRARFKRNEIVAAPGEWSSEDKKSAPINPALNFAILDFLQELRWPVKYEKRESVLKAKEMRMLGLIRSSRFIIPIQHEGPAEIMEDGRLKFTKDTKIKFLIMKTKDEKQFIPLYTDSFQFSRHPQAKDWNVGVFGYPDILKFVQDKDGININPEGQGLVMTKERMMSLEFAAQQANVAKLKNNAVKKAAEATGDAVKSAVSQAEKELKEDKQ